MGTAARIPETGQRGRGERAIEVPERFFLEHRGDRRDRRGVAQRHHRGQRLLASVIVAERGLKLGKPCRVLHVRQSAGGCEAHRLLGRLHHGADPGARGIARDADGRPDSGDAHLGHAVGEQREDALLALRQVLGFAQKADPGERDHAHERFRIFQEVGKPRRQDCCCVGVAGAPALDQRTGGVHAQRPVGRIERLARIHLRLRWRGRCGLRVLPAEQRREQSHHFTWEPGFTSPGSSMAVCSRSPPLA